jgi:hypothetical protein
MPVTSLSKMFELGKQRLTRRAVDWGAEAVVNVEIGKD